MGEISKAMDRSRRERGKAGDERLVRPGPHRVITGAMPQQIPDSDIEEYLTLAAETTLALPDAESRVVMFASAVAREGTSTVAREFATVLAGRQEAETLLVDANLRAPSLHEVFRTTRDPGLSDHVLGDVPLSECLRETGELHLSLLPAGRPVIAPPRVFGDSRIRGMLSELRRRFAYITIDASPLIGSPEGGQVSRLADCVVLVIRFGHTRRQLPERALELLEDAGAEVLGTVLNRRRFYIPRFVYERL
jgi:capsular exopolysaccharide synthesis family protein